MAERVCSYRNVLSNEEHKRVCYLYRVSTTKQVDHDDQNQADIPVQRKACREFADRMGWTIVLEEQGNGVSGFKVSANDRDKINGLLHFDLLPLPLLFGCTFLSSGQRRTYIWKSCRKASSTSGVSIAACGSCGSRRWISTPAPNPLRRTRPSCAGILGPRTTSWTEKNTPSGTSSRGRIGNTMPG